MIDVKKYTKRITILQSQDVIDDIGNVDCIWTVLHRCWASVNCTGGKKFYEAAQTNVQDYVTFKMRYCQKISGMSATKIRISYDNKIYNVKYIDDYFEQHKELKILAEEVL